MSKNIQEWEDWQQAAMDEQAARVARALGGDFLKMKLGDNYFRFLPPLRGQKSPFVEVWQHFVGGNDITIPGRDKALVFLCPEKTSNDPCTTCDRARELARSRSKEDRELAKKLNPGLRVFANVIDLENPDAGPQILPFGKQVFDQLMAIATNPRKGGNFTHPVTGFPICIEKTGQQMSTKYAVTTVMGEEGGPQELEDMDWIMQQNELSELVTLPSEEDEALVLTAIEAVASTGSGALPRPTSRGVGTKRLPRERTGRSRAAAKPDAAPGPAKKKVVKKKVVKKAVKAGGYTPRTQRRAQDTIDEDY